VLELAAVDSPVSVPDVEATSVVVGGWTSVVPLVPVGGPVGSPEVDAAAPVLGSPSVAEELSPLQASGASRHAPKRTGRSRRIMPP
jgi:hypothetical protein